MWFLTISIHWQIFETEDSWIFHWGKCKFQINAWQWKFLPCTGGRNDCFSNREVVVRAEQSEPRGKKHAPPRPPAGPVPILSGIEAKPSPSKGLALLIPHRIFRPSYGHEESESVCPIAWRTLTPSSWVQVPSGWYTWSGPSWFLFLHDKNIFLNDVEKKNC